MMTSLEEKVPANSVPAAAVIREARVLFEMIRRKGHVGCQLCLKHTPQAKPYLFEAPLIVRKSPKLNFGISSMKT